MSRISPDLDRELGSDLALLVQTVTTPLAEVTPLSSRGHPHHRPNAYRLQFADGRILKASRLETPEQAEVVEALSRRLDHWAVPAVLARSGAALLAPWVDGQRLTATDCPRGLLRRCGALQALVHRRPLPDGAAHSPEKALARWHHRLQHNLDELVEAKVLASGEARYTAAVAGQYAPRRWQVGVTLGDFCAENIVVRASGELCVIDNETLSVGPCDYDLGRTWYRWPMARGERAAYLGGYAEHRSPDEHIAHFPYWAIMAVVDGAAFRRRRRPETTMVPVSRLRALVHDLERGLSPSDVMFLS